MILRSLLVLSCVAASTAPGESPDQTAGGNSTSVEKLSVFEESASVDAATGVAESDVVPEVVPEFTTESAQLAFDRVYGAEQYGEATDAGKLVIQLMLKSEHDRMLFADALEQLADAQRLAGKFEPAIENYLAAIGVIESESDRLSERLVGPLWELSRSYAQNWQFDQAAESYEKALHIHGVNHGPQHAAQSELLLEMSEVYFALGEFEQADSLNKYNIAVAHKNNPDDGLQTLPARYARAEMLRRMGYHDKEMETYEDLIQAIEHADGRRSLHLLPALDKLARAIYMTTDETGHFGVELVRRQLMRAIAIAENDDRATPVQRADVHLAMGDLLTLTEDHRAALRKYRKAWDILSEDAALLVERDARFADPVTLTTELSVTPELLDTELIKELEIKTPEGERKEGVVSVAYMINKYGETRKLDIVESDPPDFMDGKIRRELRAIAFRPRIVDRKPTETRNLRIDIRFPYTDEDLRSKRASEAATVSAERGAGSG